MADNEQDDEKNSVSKRMMGNLKLGNSGKNSEEQAEEEEMNRVDPCNSIKIGKGLDLGVMDWGKCKVFKPCCRKIPGCGCFAMCALMISCVGGVLSSILIF